MLFFECNVFIVFLIAEFAFVVIIAAACTCPAGGAEKTCANVPMCIQNPVKREKKGTICEFTLRGKVVLPMVKADGTNLNEAYLKNCLERLSSVKMRQNDLEKFEEAKREMQIPGFFENGKKLTRECGKIITLLSEYCGDEKKRFPE